MRPRLTRRGESLSGMVRTRLKETLNMMNIEQELEVNGPGWEAGSLIIVDARLEDEYIYVNLRGKDSPEDRIDYYDWGFWAKTGVYVGHEQQDNPLRLRPKSATRPVTHYFLFAGRPDWSKDGWVKLEMEKFPSGKEAAERMKFHNGLFTSSMSPFRTMVKSEVELTDIRDYPQWAEFRFESGEFGKLPWADEPWFKDNVPDWHYAHLGVQDNCMVAFWESEGRAQNDHVTLLAPGKYLTRYFSDYLSPTEIRDWAVKVDVEATLKFATTPDEIESIYLNGPGSCMSHDADDYSSAEHPVRIYGAGDLAIAYLERKGKIVGRAICWPDKKVAGRRYGDIERLTAQLADEGYRIDRGGEMNGARVLRIKDGSKLIAPYMDNGYGMSFPPKDMENRDDFMVMTTSYEIDCTNTDGYASGRNHNDQPDYDWHCESCGEGMYDDDEYHLDDSVYCETCHDERAVTCHSCDCRTHRTNSRMVEVDGEPERYCNSCYDEDCVVICDYCDNATANPVQIYDARYEYGPDAEPDLDGDACQNCIDSDDNLQQDVNGRWINTENAIHCDTCGNYRSDELEHCSTPSCDPQAANQNELPLETQEVEAA